MSDVLRFQNAVFAELAPGARKSESLKAALGDLLHASREAWPNVGVDGRAFGGHLGRILAKGPNPTEALAQVRGTDLYLAFACGLGDAEALRAFMQGILPRALRAAGRARADDPLKDELNSTLAQRLLVGAAGRAPRILDYAGRGELASWVCAAAIRTALNLRPHAQSERLDASHLQQRVANEDPELHLVKSTYRPAFKAALEQAFGALSAEERSILRMSLVDRLSIDRLATMLGTHRSTVARRLARIREGLVQGTKQRLRVELGIRGTELDSLMRVVKSQLSVSVSQLFAPPPFR